MSFSCPRCGDDTDQLHEGYCFACCEAGQNELDNHNIQFDAWQQKSDRERGDAIKQACALRVNDAKGGAA